MNSEGALTLFSDTGMKNLEILELNDNNIIDTYHTIFKNF